ncbi:MAG: tetratricopeptide repeat protein [Acidobacteria bacterium]|nr:tetratricopeptide repeat protein [Acidobacteriota bacterium]
MARSTVPRAALVEAAVAALLPLSSHPAVAQDLEQVLRPRTDQYEQVVRDQMASAHDELDRLQNDPAATPSDLAAAFGLLGQLYLLYDYHEPARAALRNAEALDGQDLRWPYYLADLTAREGDPETAAAALDRVLSIDPGNVAALIRRGNALLELGRLDDAERDYSRAVDRDPRQSAARLGLGRVRYERGDFEQAIEHFQAAIQDQPEGSAIHHHIGLALRRLGRREEAAAHFEQNEHRLVVFADPLKDRVDQLNVSAEAHYFRGTSALRRGDARGALDAFLLALEAKPDSARNVFSVGLAQIELGNKQAAEARMRQAIALDANYREPHFNLALILAERGDYEAAERHFGRAAEIDSADFEASARRADALTRLGRIEEAIEVLNQVLESEPAMPVALLTLGAAHQAAGRPEQAWGRLREVLAAAPGAPRERAEAHYRLAVITSENPELAAGNAPASEDTSAGEDDNVRAHLRSALELDPGLIEAHALLGRLLAQQGQYPEAASHFARAISRNPANAGWHRDRAMALILGRRYAAARGALTSGLGALERANPEASEAAVDHLRILLSRLLSTCPDPQIRDGRQALGIAQRLMADRPSLEHAETMAMALAETGNLEQAADIQQQVLAEVERRGGTPSAGQRQRLRNYVDGRPAREPWFDP